MMGYGIISMRGRTSGTVKLYPEGGAVIALRSRHTPERAYFIDRSGAVEACRVKGDGRCEVKLKSICAAAVYDGEGRLLCSGAIGACGRRLHELLPELSIRTVSELAKMQPSAEEARQEAAPDKPASPVTQSILMQAQRLFAENIEGEGSKQAEPAEVKISEQSAQQAEPAEVKISEQSAQQAEPAENNKTAKSAEAPVRAIKNPFPRTYPNSYWQMRQGSDMLYGAAQTARGKLIIRAVPVQRGARRPGFERYLIDVNGRAYRAHEMMSK